MKNIVMVGNGKWAQNYVATIKNMPINLKIADRNNWKRLINEQPDGAIVCTPPESHIEIADYCLDKNIPTIIEKPICLNVKDIKYLNKHKTPIIVNYVHLFSQQYTDVKNSLNELKIKSIYSMGFNKGPFRDYSSLWDYGPHDLSMILDIVKEDPLAIKITENNNLFSINLTFNNIVSNSIVGGVEQHGIALCGGRDFGRLRLAA